MKKQQLMVGLIGVMLLGLVSTASATILLANGVFGGSGDVQNVLLDTASGNTASGHLNQDTGTFVDFTGTEDLLIQGGGQARIEAVDGAFDSLSWQLRDLNLGFSKLQFNVNTSSDDRFSNSFRFTFTDQFGTDFVFNGGDTITDNEVLRLDRSGENFFTAYSLDNQVIVSALIEVQGITSLVFDDVRQVRLNPVTRDPVAPPVPEPGTILLLGAGLVGLAVMRRKSSKN